MCRLDLEKLVILLRSFEKANRQCFRPKHGGKPGDKWNLSGGSRPQFGDESDDFYLAYRGLIRRLRIDSKLCQALGIGRYA